MKNALESTAAVILAAGRGTRMNATDRNKVTFTIGGQPMIKRTVENLRKAGVGQIIAVVGYQAESVRHVLGDTVDYVVQKEQLGTGDALRAAIPELREDIDTVLSVGGDDSAFYPPDLYREMVEKQRSHEVPLLFLTIHKDDPKGLGRIVRDEKGDVRKIVEEKVATEQEKRIQEVNTGFYCFDRRFLENQIGLIERNPVSQEYYVTDMIEIALAVGTKIETLFVRDASIWHGVNNQEDLANARAKLR